MAKFVWLDISMRAPDSFLDSVTDQGKKFALHRYSPS